MPNVQRALQADPGRFRGLLAFGSKAPEDPAAFAQVINRAAVLLKELESIELNDKPLKILVALAPRVLSEHAEWPRLKEEYFRIDDFHDRQPAVLVQIAAETEDERTYAIRLVRRIFEGTLSLLEEHYGGRHLMSREAFGYRDASLSEKPRVPESQLVPGVSWLLYQRCVQNLDAFHSLAVEEQDKVIGRARDDASGAPPLPGSHIELARRQGTASDGTPLLVRRSFGYEQYGESGLLFLASAAHSKYLHDAWSALDKDPLKKYIDFQTGGLYVVPPSSGWLAQGQQIEALESRRPPAEQSFYPKHTLLLYEVTPSTLQFFLRVFHNNKDNFDQGGTLRSDVKLMAKGLAKMLYGARLDKSSKLYQFLEKMFDWDNSEAFMTDEVRLEIEDLRRSKRNREALVRISETRDKIRQAVTSKSNLEQAARDLSQTSLLELFAEAISSDAEYLSGSPAERKEDFQTLIDLCVKAADEARQLNREAGRYMTFMC